MDSSDDNDFEFDGFQVEDVVLAEDKLNKLLEEASDINNSDIEDSESDFEDKSIGRDDGDHQDGNDDRNAA
jgi:hypothetical protein